MSIDVRYMKLKTIVFLFSFLNFKPHPNISTDPFLSRKTKLKFYSIFFIILSIASRIDVNKKTESQTTVLGSSYF